MDKNLPKSKMYDVNLKPPKDEKGKDMELPIPIGYSREGFIWTDLARLPHLVVAGETRE